MSHKLLNLKGTLVSLDKPLVMGILNVTPDSFYAASRKETEAAIDARIDEVPKREGILEAIRAILQEAEDRVLSRHAPSTAREVVNRFREAGHRIAPETDGGIDSGEAHRPVLRHQQGEAAEGRRTKPAHGCPGLILASWESEPFAGRCDVFIPKRHAHFILFPQRDEEKTRKARR